MNAISKNEDGIVVVDESKCVGCQMCARACQFNVPQFIERKMVKCDLCVGRYDMASDVPPCVATCPTQALKLVKVSVEEKKAAEAALLKLLASDTLKK
jgi:anaerobic dimethyl sulfoxide reductase subunit B (iron-sulfur subunit)